MARMRDMEVVAAAEVVVVATERTEEDIDRKFTHHINLDEK